MVPSVLGHILVTKGVITMYAYQRASCSTAPSSFEEQQKEVFGYFAEHTGKIESYKEGSVFKEYQKQEAKDK